MGVNKWNEQIMRLLTKRSNNWELVGYSNQFKYYMTLFAPLRIHDNNNITTNPPTNKKKQENSIIVFH